MCPGNIGLSATEAEAVASTNLITFCRTPDLKAMRTHIGMHTLFQLIGSHILEQSMPKLVQWYRFDNRNFDLFLRKRIYGCFYI